MKLLILGGTTEASALARAVAGLSQISSLLSFAGRTESPVAPPIPWRTGGFGGIQGLTGFLQAQAIDAVVDATHPFAARMSANAVAACASLEVPLVTFTRSAWTPGPGDRWTPVPDVAAAIDILGALAAEASDHNLLSVPDRGAVGGRALAPNSPGGDVVCAATGSLQARISTMGLGRRARSVFLTTGRLDLARFKAAPAHRYLVRSIDPPDPVDLPPQTQVVLARPPFPVVDEIALLQAHGIDLLVTKNSGGAASAAKLVAARALGVPVLMVDRPPPSGAQELTRLDDVLAWIAAR